MIRITLTLVLAAFSWLTFASWPAQAATQAESTRRSEQYYVAAGKTYNMHAHDHARMLGKYAAASDQPVPSAIVKEHAKAIRANVVQAQHSYEKLAQAAPDNAQLEKQLAQVRQRLAAVTGQIDKLDRDADDEAVDSNLIASETADIAKNLKATHLASKEIDNALAAETKSSEQFDNPQSDSYYFTGEGHFID